tara:strand:+ start:362 stop:1369 length:1008 start_codon:yes stop_codon:yes gene_type:complete
VALTKVRGAGIDADGQEIILDADGDTSIDASSADDTIVVDTAGSERIRIDASGNIGVGLSSPTFSSGNGIHLADSFFVGFGDGANSRPDFQIGYGGTNLNFRCGNGADTSDINIDPNGHLLIGTDTNSLSGTNADEHIILENDGELGVQGAAKAVATFNRNLNDGTIVLFQQQNTAEGSIGVSGSTVSFDGFVGRHESSGISTETEKGTVVSTIDELDIYPTKQGEGKKEADCPRAGQTRADHPKVKISDTVGDKRVYGVVDSYTAQDKLMVSSVGIGSIKVTGACAGGDLLESNGDGTAKVQSDDVIRSKTIGKVTIGDSNTGVKLVSCVLYCG